MLLHDSYFHYSNRSINNSHTETIIVSYSPLFHSTFTLIISIFGLLINLICWIKIVLILSQYQQRKLRKSQEQSQDSRHVLSHKKYRFLLILTTNDFLLCLSSIISCLDEKYFYQSFLGRHHLCAVHIFMWKFTLHFIPLLTIAVLCRYHYLINKTFQIQRINLSTFKQLLCSDLNILIAFVLAVAWSIDGIWLWGVADIKDYFKPPSSSTSVIESIPKNQTVINDYYFNESLEYVNRTLRKEFEENDNRFQMFLSEQNTICYFLTNSNYEFSVRLIHLIEADFFLLFILHLIGLCLEITLLIRLCCCIIMRKVTSAFNHERQLCLYILYIFILMTLTSLPFYFYRIGGIIFDTQANTGSNDFNIGRTFSQILLIGICFKPLLIFILFFPPPIIFYLKCYCKCYSPTTNDSLDHNEEIVSFMDTKQQQQQQLSSVEYHQYLLLRQSSRDEKFHPKSRTDSNPV
ncbi:hypothetical protein I4U23_030534 [Adineta vaga]|nr:hypothetical protein I4U23_030534 [Adineta vaga]